MPNEATRPDCQVCNYKGNWWGQRCCWRCWGALPYDRPRPQNNTRRWPRRVQSTSGGPPTGGPTGGGQPRRDKAKGAPPSGGASATSAEVEEEREPTEVEKLIVAKDAAVAAKLPAEVVNGIDLRLTEAKKKRDEAQPFTQVLYRTDRKVERLTKGLEKLTAAAEAARAKAVEAMALADEADARVAEQLARLRPRRQRSFCNNNVIILL